MEKKGVCERRRLHVRRTRIGVDLDKPSRLQLLKTYFNARYFFRGKNVEVKATEKGFHFRIATPNTVDQNIDVRRNLGDDQTRLKFDEKRRKIPALHHWIDTLFQAKYKCGKVISMEEPCNPLCEALITKLPSRKP